MSQRIWNLRFNLDEFNQASALLGDDLARGVFMRGMTLGMNGGAPPATAPEEFLAGYRFGLATREEALSFQDRRAKGGHASAEARREKYGSARPNSARTVLEQCSSDVQALPDQCVNQSTIDNLRTYKTGRNLSPDQDERNVGTRIAPLAPCTPGGRP